MSGLFMIPILVCLIVNLAKDPWLAGKSINYYYYGQYMFTYLVKMLGMNTKVGYNISMCTAIAFPFIAAYSLGQLFIDALRQKKDCQVSKHYLPFAGLLRLHDHALR